MKDTFTINKDGKEITFRTLLTFYNESVDKHYVVYTDDTVNEQGNVNVLVSSYDPEVENSPLLAVETPEEWEIVSAALDDFQAELMEKINEAEKNEVIDIEEKTAPAVFEMNGAQYKVLATLVDEQNGVEYVLYMPENTTEEKVEVLVGKLLEKDEKGIPTKVGAIETEEEWKSIEEPVREIIEHLNKQD